MGHRPGLEARSGGAQPWFCSTCHSRTRRPPSAAITAAAPARSRRTGSIPASEAPAATRIRDVAPPLLSAPPSQSSSWAVGVSKIGSPISFRADQEQRPSVPQGDDPDVVPSRLVRGPDVPVAGSSRPPHDPTRGQDPAVAQLIAPSAQRGTRIGTVPDDEPRVGSNTSSVVGDASPVCASTRRMSPPTMNTRPSGWAKRCDWARQSDEWPTGAKDGQPRPRRRVPCLPPGPARARRRGPSPRSRA